MKKTVFLLAAAFANGQTLTNQAAQATLRKPTFLLPEQVNMSAILPAPPADPSADIAELKRVQSSRTEAQIALAKRDDADESMFVFADVLGEKFKKESLPLTGLLSDHVRYDASPIVRVAKGHFHRPRPFHFDAEVKPVCKANAFDPAKANFAYPSGHGTVGYIEALVLIQMLPEKREAILARADAYAYNRVVCGVHYPSDLPASKATAYAMMGLLMNNPFFQKELAAAKTELRSALGY